MKTLNIALGLVLAANTAFAQSADKGQAADTSSASKGDPAASVSNVKKINIQNLRAYDKRGVNVFEAPKDDGTPYTGFKVDFGAAFTQEFQNLSHSNTAAVKNAVDATGKPYNANQLMTIGSGFNNAVANAYADIQLAPGIRVALTSYLSARHHQETWVKDGYILIDQSPIKVKFLNDVMQYVTLKVGHFEVNYGDAHFRRSDNGNALWNAFVGNTIMDPMTTEIGAEAYVRKGPFLAMVGTTAGESAGKVTVPDQRSMALVAKLGVDGKVMNNLRVRLTASRYQTDKSTSAVLYQGDRGGSPYYMVLENVAATTTANAWSGTLNPGFKNQLKATMLNSFIKCHDAELFATYEKSKGKETAETTYRNSKQFAVDGVYRLMNEQLYVAARYNKANAELKGYTNEVAVRRTQLGGGWFVTPSLLAKAELVNQKYIDFPTTDIRNGGKFNGIIIAGVVAF